MKGKKGHFDFPTFVISVAGGVIGYILAQKYLINKLSAKEPASSKNIDWANKK